MSNVLTTQKKKEIDRLMRGRFILLTGVMFSITALIAILSLAPAYLSLRIGQVALQTPTDNESTSESRQDQEIATKISGSLKALAPVVNATSSPSSAIAVALAAKPAQTSVTSITYTPGTLALTGESPRREAVNEFRLALERTGLFTTVNVPVAALVGAQNGNFTITLKGGF